MKSLTESVCEKRWQLYALIALAGFATGNVLAKITGALGI